MSESKPKEQKPEKKRRLDPELLREGYRCDLDQYEMLKRCSNKKDMTEWNEWRKANPNEDILLERKSFHGFYLSGALLNTGVVVINPGTSQHEQWVFPGEVYLKGSLFLQAKLCKTDFRGTHLEKAIFNSAELEGACLELAYLQGTSLKGATFDKYTSFEGCYIDKQTDFRESDLASLRVSPRIRQLMEYNIRRKNWEEYYKDENVPFTKEMISKSLLLKLLTLTLAILTLVIPPLVILALAMLTLVMLPIDTKQKVINWFLKFFLIKPFWGISDYGKSTWRIIGWFLGLSLLFAEIYANLAYLYPPGIVSNLEVEPHLPIWHDLLLLLLRPIYFSVVTMTTLGFGDMYANAHSIWGHILLSIQVILGYVLLGALITRFAVLFRGGGPAGDFPDDKK